MRLLLFGSTGQVGHEIMRCASTAVDIVVAGRAYADLAFPESCRRLVEIADVDAVINCAAWTAVDEAERQEAAAYVVNASAPAEMASACAKRGLPFLHLSTDYVFDGSGKSAFRPDDRVGPINAYGRTKLAGEIAIRESAASHLILRTSWVFSAHGKNFVKTMCSLGATRDEVSVVADQIGGPTPASSIARALLVAARAMAAGAVGGTHHFSGGPDVSWAEFARCIMTTAELSCRVLEIPSSDYPTPAPRPQNSRLDCSSFKAAFGVARPDWQIVLKNVLAEMEASS